MFITQIPYSKKREVNRKLHLPPAHYFIWTTLSSNAKPIDVSFNNILFFPMRHLINTTALLWSVQNAWFRYDDSVRQRVNDHPGRQLTVLKRFQMQVTFTQISQNIKASKKALTCGAIDEEPLGVSRGVWHRNVGSRSSRLCLCFIARQHDWLDIYRFGCYAAFWG